MQTKMYVVFDLDGTLSLDDHRAHHLYGPNGRDWDAYFDACGEDSPNYPVINMNSVLREAGYQTVILTGRSSKVRTKTTLWLQRNGVKYDFLLMRPEDDRTQDHVLKINWGAALGLSNIFCVFEDRQRVVDAWRAVGVFVYQTAKGDF